jgi:hypothetical protein
LVAGARTLTAAGLGERMGGRRVASIAQYLFYDIAP